MLARKDTYASSQGDEEPDGEPEHSARSSTALNLTGASIRDSSFPGEHGDAAPRGAPSIVLPHQEASYVRHIALDIGGSLIKLVYFSPDAAEPGETAGPAPGAAPRASHGHHHKGGRMHFVKFETARLGDCLDFIQAKGLHRCMLRDGSSREVRVKATGGGAIRFAEVFKERLGLVLEREDEIGCAVGGCNFLLRTITHEAFAFEAGQAQFVPTSSCEGALFPYLLVNIGSGVSIIRVDGPGEGQHTRVSGSSVGGGTFWGLCRLLTGRRDFDEMLELSMQGNNANVDMLVGDIYGGRDYSSIGLSASTIACSFGKVVGQDRELDDYNPADVAMSLCRMVAYNIGQLAYMHAKRYALTRVFFGGFFIRGHPYTMETISFAIKFWSQGEMSALFLRHEGFLGAVGAFLKVHPMALPGGSGAAWARGGRAAPGASAGDAGADAGGAGGERGAAAARGLANSASTKVRARFVERFSMGAPFAGGEVHGPAIRDMTDRVSWVEKFVAVGCQAAAAQQAQAAAAAAREAGGAPDRGGARGARLSLSVPVGVEGPGGVGQPPSPTYLPTRIPLHVGVLHYSPTQEPFPLLADPASYTPNTIDINTDDAEYTWLLQVLEDQVPTVVEKAIKSEGGGDAPRRRAAAFGRAFAAHLQKLRQDPGAYGQLGLSDLFEMREECLREFGFSDVYGPDKAAENGVALQVLPDLLTELDGMGERERLLSLVQGILAANIFDWGAKACVELYTNGTILDIYREARRRLSKRPWRVDDFDAFAARVHGAPAPGSAPGQQGAAAAQQTPGEAQVGARMAGLALAAAAAQAQQRQLDGGGGAPPPGGPFAGGGAAAPPGAGPAAPGAADDGAAADGGGGGAGGGSRPPFRRVMVFVDNAGADIVLGMLPFVREMLRLGCEVVMVANSLPAINDITAAELRSLLSEAAEVCPIIKAARRAALAHEAPSGGRGAGLVGGPTIPPYPGLRQRQSSAHDLQALASASSAGSAAAGRPIAAAAGSPLPGGGTACCSGSSGVGAFGSPLSSMDGAAALPAAAMQQQQQQQQQQQHAGPAAAGAPRLLVGLSRQGGAGAGSGSSSASSSLDGGAPPGPDPGAALDGGADSSSGARAVVVEPKLFVLGNGSGSPCLDLSRVPAALADATVGVDLLVIEGMGRAIHTNLRASFKCDTLKLAMIKTERLAAKLFRGALYDCMCAFAPGARA
ncbi:pantothenate kinase 2 [Scenedesmus sp. PABB004]|nr:pantothenate kinase 2 [Scenedesmus sp. PABB004]